MFRYIYLVFLLKTKWVCPLFREGKEKLQEEKYTEKSGKCQSFSYISNRNEGSTARDIGYEIFHFIFQENSSIFGLYFLSNKFSSIYPVILT